MRMWMCVCVCVCVFAHGETESKVTNWKEKIKMWCLLLSLWKEQQKNRRTKHIHTIPHNLTQAPVHKTTKEKKTNTFLYTFLFGFETISITESKKRPHVLNRAQMTAGATSFAIISSRVYSSYGIAQGPINPKICPSQSSHWITFCRRLLVSSLSPQPPPHPPLHSQIFMFFNGVGTRRGPSPAWAWPVRANVDVLVFVCVYALCAYSVPWCPSHQSTHPRTHSFTHPPTNLIHSLIHPSTHWLLYFTKRPRWTERAWYQHIFFYFVFCCCW